jgi:hypothetical protein
VEDRWYQLHNFHGGHWGRNNGGAVGAVVGQQGYGLRPLEILMKERRRYVGCARTKRKKWPITDHERQKVSLILTLYFSRFNFPKLIQLSGIILKKLLIPET